MKLGRGQILMTEGIHGLNEALTPDIPSENKFKIYVSALTQLCLDDHNRIFTTDTRLCRRIMRDRLFRGTTAAETIAGWASVRAGESRYIFPFQEDANVIFNSALSYEHALLKPYAERFLAEVPRSHPSFMEASRLVRFFSLFLPILPQEVPHNSILREFIGGSTFRYT
jgi:uridine kinase